MLQKGLALPYCRWKLKLERDEFHGAAWVKALQCGERQASKMVKQIGHFSFEGNKPREYPNSKDMMGRFLGAGFVWLRHVNTSRNFDPRRRLGGKCKPQLAEPSKELFMK